MAKTKTKATKKTTKAKHRGRRKGDGTIDKLTQELSKAVGREGTKTAKQLVLDHDADVIRLAFRQIPKGNTMLTPREEEHYEEFYALSPKKAETWKRKKLATKQAKRNVK